MKIMVQGTSSSCGKSLTAAALCRIFFKDGYSVCPFKSQNMSLNSFVTIEGYEMGRAQALQAYAANIEPEVYMNPILLKPTTDHKSQVIFMGKPISNMGAKEYFTFKPKLKNRIYEIYKEIEKKYDVVVIEGAGSPAEINLKKDDFVNMGMAEMADSNVILVADIDRGGVFAQIYGTYMLLEEEERKRIKGVIINKFRGDKSLLEPGIRMLEELIPVKVIGVVPYFEFNLDDEDSASGFKNFIKNGINVAVIKLPKISNFTDFDCFKFEEDVSLKFISRPEEMADADLVILPGSKNTISDLRWLKEKGFDSAIRNFEGIVFGICGGYQMMGKEIFDKYGVEVKEGTYEEGIGIFDTKTLFLEEKRLERVEGTAFLNKIYGYEIHMGITIDNKNPFVFLKDRMDGDCREDRFYGTYVHGIFDSGEFRSYILNKIRRKKGLEERRSEDLTDIRNRELDRLEKIFRDNIDIDYIYKLL
ncbi:cobyric acid synthase [Caloramator proteoclasticus]|uniref:Cobyric acid synthase n=1 Tax=Caloramator proteoclasticus DSM 10124 TaxID=1121262 RepID=A0A1M4S8F0_9CLOT|nr:cobyric acid synthase [Caloramator proteoclasticus]SHE28479.1 adenosylcobyric acid synthase (glutamine-hydrolysing) [Caloramator proteoclasticus DSM 10124]